MWLHLQDFPRKYAVTKVLYLICNRYHCLVQYILDLGQRVTCFAYTSTLKSVKDEATRGRVWLFTHEGICLGGSVTEFREPMALDGVHIAVGIGQDIMRLSPTLDGTNGSTGDWRKKCAKCANSGESCNIFACAKEMHELKYKDTLTYGRIP